MAHVQVEVLRIVGGQRQRGAPAGVAVLTPPLRPAPGREGDLFLMVLDLGDAPSRLYREVREAAAQAFWDTPGSVTAALRLAVAAANRVLFRRNREVVSQDRRYGGISCAALKGEECFLAQAGPACAWALGKSGLAQFHPTDFPPIGAAVYVEVRVSYLTFGPGDTLLIATQGLLRSASDDALRRVLPRAELEAVVDGLEQVAMGEDLTAVAVRWTVEEKAVEAPPPPRRRRPRAAPPPPPPAPIREEVLLKATAPPPSTTVPESPPARVWEEETEKAEEVEIPVWKPAVEPAPARPRPKGPPLWVRLRLRDRLRWLGRWAGRAGAAVGGGLRALFRRALPGRERRIRRRRKRRPPPPENPWLMAGIAIAILILVIVVTLVTWLTYGTAVRHQQTLEQARQQATLARQAADPAEARGYWESVVATLADMEGDPEAADLQAQAQAALDRIDGVIRVEPALLRELSPDVAIRRLVVYGSNLFLLDEGEEEVLQLPLDGGGATGTGGTGIVVPIGVEGGGKNRRVDLVDMTWNPVGEGWATNALVILEEAGRLWVYDPQWPDNVFSIPLGPAPGEGAPVAIATFEGRLYLLDPVADQIWRYRPREGGYPDRAEPYFPTHAPQSLAGARDFAIDGNIYVLFRDGSVAKYFQGEPAAFQITGVPGPAPLFVSLAVNPREMDGPIYLADGADERIVILSSAGGFEAQVRASPGVFHGLRALALDDTGTRLLVVAGRRLYILPVPPLP